MENLKTYIATISDLSEESWKLLSECATEIKLRKKDYLLSEGERCNAIFFVSSGLCRSVYNKDGKMINTAFYFENDFITNINSLKTSSPSAYSIQSYETSHIIRLDKTKLLAAYSKSRQIETFGRKLLELIIAQQEEHANSFKLFTPKQRFDHLTIRHSDFLQRVSLSQIASYLGISRETLSRFRAAK